MIRTLPAALSLVLPLVAVAVDGEDPVPTGAVADEDAPADANVLRVYDVSTLRMGEGHVGRDWDGALLPFIHYNADDADEDHEEGSGESGADALIDLIVDLYGAEFEYEGRRVSMGEGDRLAVQGPDALHERVQGLIGFFESAVNAQATLTVDVLRFRKGAPLAREACLVDAAQAEELLRGAQTKGEHASYDVHLRPDRVAMLDLARDQPLVTDYDVEIAQGASIEDPVVTIVSAGTRLMMRAAPAEDGMFLALSLKRGDLLASEPDDLGMHWTIASEKGGAEYVEHASRLANPLVLARSMALSTYLPHGKALLIQSAIDLQRSGATEVLLLRHTGGGLPTRHELPLGEDGARIVFADMGAVAPPWARARGALLEPNYVPATLEGRGRPVMLDAELRGGDLDFALDLIDSGQDYSSLELHGRWMVSRPYGSFLGEDALQVKAEQDRVVAAFDALRPRGELLDVSVTVQRTGAAGGTPVSARLPVRPGTSATLALGIEGLDAFDYDVEVAQLAATPDPQTRTTFDGLCVWLKPTLTAGGELLLEVRGGANLWVADQHVDLGSLSFERLDQSVFHHLFVNERILLRRADGAWRATLGDAGTRGEEEGLRIDVVVRRPE